MFLRWRVSAALGLAAIVAAVLLIAFLMLGPRSGHVKDEAMLAGLTVDAYPSAGRDLAYAQKYNVDADFFSPMDNGATLSDDEVKGRDMWLVWTGGNDRLWDQLINDSFGTFDLLKTISSNPGPLYKFSRDNRWTYFGIINEPCFSKPVEPDPKRFGLWLDQRDPKCAPDPFADESKFPGVKIGARGVDGFPVGSFYGEPTGIVGLRLFPNPNFDAAARAKWDPVRYYDDPTYYRDPNLVRPYRVGMACGFCHVGPSPIAPPADPENPQWSNLNSTVGAQYFWFDRVFAWEADPSNFIYQLVHSYLPGTIDTSLVSSDNIDNPRTMNAIYQTTARVLHANPFGREKLTGGQLDNKQFNDFPGTEALDGLWDAPYAYTPRVLKDGSDSVGVLGALNRVYLNIGLFSEEWLTHFRPFVGIQRISPIRIADAQKNSVYWQATERQTIYMAKFLLAAGKPDRLDAVAPQYLTTDQAALDRGKTVFAETCARCHSSKLPVPVVGIEGPDAAECNGPGYLECWNRYWAWTKTDDFKTKMLKIVEAPDFLNDNYLSTEFRVPVTLLQTNACSPLARNALADNIWDNFSSQSYKDLPSVGEIDVKDPITGADRKFDMPAGGRGYTRPPSLVSLWSTGPYLLNNSVGPFSPDPSVAARMKVFNASIRQMLWPKTRERDPTLGSLGVGHMARTTQTSWLKIPKGFIPSALYWTKWPVNALFPTLFTDDGDVQIGPIPKGTPIGLLGNFDPLSESRGLWARAGRAQELVGLFLRVRHDLSAMPVGADDATAAKILGPLGRQLYETGTCPDYEMNRGHYFGTDLLPEEPGLSDADKNALIEYLKTL
ncbi:MAG: hypothetical protein ACOH2H_21415 [Cypionkella sp.]